MSSGQRAGFWGVFHLLSEKGFLPDVYTPFIPDPLQGASIYDVHTEGGGRGVYKYREIVDKQYREEVACFSAPLRPIKHATSARRLIYSQYRFCGQRGGRGSEIPTIM